MEQKQRICQKAGIMLLEYTIRIVNAPEIFKKISRNGWMIVYIKCRLIGDNEYLYKVFKQTKRPARECKPCLYVAQSYF